MTHKSIDDIIHASRLATLVFPESTAMKSIQKAIQASQQVSLAFPELTAMKSIQKAIWASQKASRLLPEPSAIKSIQGAMQASKLASLAFEESAAMKSIREAAQVGLSASLNFPEPAVIKLARDSMRGSHAASLAFQETAAMKSIRQMLELNPLAGLGELPSLKAAAQLENSPFSKSTLAAFDSLATSALVQSDKKILEIDSQISKEVSLETDFNALSDKTKGILLYLYHYYLLPVLLSFLVSYTMVNTAVEVRKELKSVSTLTEVRSFARTANIKLDRTALTGFRVTTANLLKLRKNPKMSAETINFLPLGTLVEVMDRSNRSWLFVDVEMDGAFIQGWVSRKYTVYFK